MCATRRTLDALQERVDALASRDTAATVAAPCLNPAEAERLASQVQMIGMGVMFGRLADEEETTVTDLLARIDACGPERVHLHRHE